ncbi:MAG: hypothetical protein WAS34_18930 [Thiolinea sp.]
MTIQFTITELTEFFCRYGLRVNFHDHLPRTIAATRKAGLHKLEAMIQQDAIKKELFDKIKTAVENPQYKIEIK